MAGSHASLCSSERAWEGGGERGGPSSALKPPKQFGPGDAGYMMVVLVIGVVRVSGNGHQKREQAMHSTHSTAQHKHRSCTTPYSSQPPTAVTTHPVHQHHQQPQPSVAAAAWLPPADPQAQTASAPPSHARRAPPPPLTHSRRSASAATRGRCLVGLVQWWGGAAVSWWCVEDASGTPAPPAGVPACMRNTRGSS